MRFQDEGSRGEQISEGSIRFFDGWLTITNGRGVDVVSIKPSPEDWAALARRAVIEARKAR